jgi:hypothetical protein
LKQNYLNLYPLSIVSSRSFLDKKRALLDIRALHIRKRIFWGLYYNFYCNEENMFPKG